MEAVGPQPLLDICLTEVCRRLESLCSKRDDGSMRLKSPIMFPQELSDQLLHKMSTTGILNDVTVGVFRNCEELRLCRVSIPYCPVSAEAFHLALCPHRLQELDASWLPGDITGADIVSGLTSNSECRSGLQRLTLTGLRLDWEPLELNAGKRVGFSSLEGLKTLNLAYTDLSDADLEDICALHHLESLDISCTAVSNLAALTECQNTLRSLKVHGLRRLHMSPARLLSVLGQLRALRHLDFSEDHFAVDGSNGKDGDETVRQLLEGSPRVLPQLISLDISGRKRVTEAALKVFLESRSGLIFLGLLATGVSSSDVLSTRKDLLFPAAGARCDAEPSLVLARPPGGYGLHFQPDHAEHGRGHARQPAQCHRRSTALRLSSWFRYLAATLVINWLSSHENPTLQRMAVAVISILVAKLTVEQTAQLSQDAFVMKQLLAIVQQKAMMGVVDSTLNFALTALWNLTDEIPAAAHNFIKCQGLELYEEVLETYHSEPSIQQKVLGLLNNIAEVEELQEDLLEKELLEHVLTLLQNSRLEVGVRYFAGGILAQLASRADTCSLDEELRATIVKQLHSSIMTWTQLEREMVSYRSFRPFCPLLRTCQAPGVQLWAVWAIHLLCSQNISLYGRMLEKDGVTELLKVLATHSDTHGDVKGLSENILQMVTRHRSQTTTRQ